MVLIIAIKWNSTAKKKINCQVFKALYSTWSHFHYFKRVCYEETKSWSGQTQASNLRQSEPEGKDQE